MRFPKITLIIVTCAVSVAGCKKGSSDPTELSNSCDEGLIALDDGSIPAGSRVSLLMTACAELLQSDCAEAVESLQTVAPEQRQQIMAESCWRPFCGRDFDDLEHAAVMDRARLLRQSCGIENSNLLTQNEFDTRFDRAILENLPEDPTTDAELELVSAAYDRISFIDWLNAEILYARAGELPEADRSRLRNSLRASILPAPE